MCIYRCLKMKKVITIFLCLVILGLLFGCNESSKSLDNCSNLNQPDKDLCYGAVATASLDVLKCDKIFSSSLVWGCYTDIAIKTQNFSICDKISDLDFKNACNRDTAIQTKNELNCEKVFDLRNNEKSMCYLEISRKKNDKSICDKISGDALKQACLTAVPY